jgi:hypothetical protein
MEPSIPFTFIVIIDDTLDPLLIALVASRAFGGYDALETVR